MTPCTPGRRGACLRGIRLRHVTTSRAPLSARILPTDVRKRLAEQTTLSRTPAATYDIAPRAVVMFHCPRHALLRLSVPSGPQVADMNFWNADDPAERFYAGKTRQIHASHVGAGDSLWSNMPFVRPLATIIGDSLAYGFDADGASVHDVIGTRCDPYTRAYLNDATTADDPEPTCHSNLVSAAKTVGLAEADVHDVLNAFMCTGFDRSGRYFAKPSPVRQGDFIEIFAHVNLLVAISACPQGDVSTACGSGEKPKCFPLKAEVFDVPEDVLQGLD